MSHPDLPLIVLRHGPWRAEVFDPRPAPAALGARFVHGGWVHRLLHGERQLTGGASLDWNAYDGHGIPETFESGLGWSVVQKGEEFLRPGAGRMLRTGDDPGEEHAMAPLSSLLDWEVETGPAHAVFRTRDSLRRPMNGRIAYQLERTIRLIGDGLQSTTTFACDVGMLRMLPLSWYPHPFIAQSRHDATAFALPAAAVAMPTPRFWFGRQHFASAAKGDDGLWRLEGEGGRAVFGGLWGCREASSLHLDGGGVLDVALDAPLDHIVLWASASGASIEPKLARTWVHGERATWSVSYRLRTT